MVERSSKKSGIRDMKFREYLTAYQCSKKETKNGLGKMMAAAKVSLLDYYAVMYEQSQLGNQVTGTPLAAEITSISALTEYRWSKARRPFYNIWPCAVEMLTKIDLGKLTAANIIPVIPELLLRFPLEAPAAVELNGRRLMNVLVGASKPITASVFREHMKGKVDSLDPDMRMEARQILSLLADEKELITIADPGTEDVAHYDLYYQMEFLDPDGEAWTAMSKFGLEKGHNLQERLELMPVSDAVLHRRVTDVGRRELVEVTKAITRIYATLCLLGDDNDLVERIVLNKDKEKYARTGDVKYVEKAERRGVRGWDIGKSVERMPHFRRPHFAIRWMGHGEPKRPELRPIKGALVHRDKLSEVPTGYLDDEQSK
jgi:hypothetical protein